MSQAVSEERAARASEGLGKRSRTRTCAGCGERVDVSSDDALLIRLIVGPEGEVAVDPGGGGFGRGAHVHPRPDCLARAAKGGLARSAKGAVRTVHMEDGTTQPLRADTLAAAIRTAMDRRIRGLLTAAVRSRSVALGSEAVAGAWDRGEAALLVVACDAAAGGDLACVRRAVSEGRAAAWGTKLELGALCAGGDERKKAAGLAVVAITSGRIAAAVRETVQASDACAGSAGNPGEARRESARASAGERGHRRGADRSQARESANAGLGREAARHAELHQVTSSATAPEDLTGGNGSGDAAGAAVNRRADG